MTSRCDQKQTNTPKPLPTWWPIVRRTSNNRALIIGALSLNVLLLGILFAEAFPPGMWIGTAFALGFIAWNIGRGAGDMVGLRSARRETEAIHLGIQLDNTEVAEDGVYHLSDAYQVFVSEVGIPREAMGDVHARVLAVADDEDMIDEANLELIVAISTMINAYSEALVAADGALEEEAPVINRITALIYTLTAIIRSLRIVLVDPRPKRAPKADMETLRGTTRATYIDVCRTYSFLKSAGSPVVTA